YIHLNPIKLIDPNWKENGIRNMEKALNYLAKFDKSSYKDYLEYERIEGGIINRQAFPEYFSGAEDFNKEIIGWLNYKKN
ncbi:MAG: hypothetical protein WCO10_03645, partial [bacterium]